MMCVLVCVCVCARAQAQLYLTLCFPMDYSLRGSFIHGISRQEYWGGLPFSHRGELSNPGIEILSLMSPLVDYLSLVPLDEMQ